MKQASPGTNFGSAPSLAVRGDGSKTFVRFDLGVLPAGSVIAQATLRIWVHDIASTGLIDVRSVTGRVWSESTITYASVPTVATTTLGSIVVTSASTPPQGS